MKLSCLQENLAKGLSIVGRAVPSRTSMPVLSNILLATDGGRLKLAATNLELSIVHWVGAHVENEGAITIPARNFIDLVNSLPPEQVNMELDAKHASLTVQCGAAQARFRGIPADEFPPLPEPKAEDGCAVAPDHLHQALTHVVFAASTDETHPVLTGVLAEFEGETLTLAAADGFRLSVRHLPLTQPVTEPFQLIIPARALAELMRILSSEEKEVRISPTPTHHQILFRLSHTVLNAQLIDGRFPDYRRIIPGSYKTRLILEREAFLQACKRAAIFARDSSNIVLFTIGEAEIVVSADSIEAGQGATRLDASVEGPPLDIAFNVRFIIDVLAALNAPQISLELTTPTSPGVVRAVGDDAFVHVVMPMQVGRR